MQNTFTYPKKEKLKRRKQLAQLFTSKQSFLYFPVKVWYLQPAQPIDFFIKAGVGSNSRHFKKAVHRNRIKRLLREAYRLNKQPLHEFLEKEKKQVIVFFLYVDKALPEGNILQVKMPGIVQELMKRLHEKAS